MSQQRKRFEMADRHEEQERYEEREEIHEERGARGAWGEKEDAQS